MIFSCSKKAVLQFHGTLVLWRIPVIKACLRYIQTAKRLPKRQNSIRWANNRRPIIVQFLKNVFWLRISFGNWKSFASWVNAIAIAANALDCVSTWLLQSTISNSKRPTNSLMQEVYYLKVYPTFDVFGAQFGMARSKACENLHFLYPILGQALVSLGVFLIGSLKRSKNSAQPAKILKLCW